MSVRTYTKSCFDFNEIWHVGRGRYAQERYPPKFSATFSARSVMMRHNVDGWCGLITSAGHGQVVQQNN